MSSYRMDGRSEDEFIRDIQKGNERERLAMCLFEKYLRRELSFDGTIVENGVDMSGEFIQDDKKVTAEADYLVNGLPLEVKTSKNHTTRIYLKVSQVDSYIKQGASLLYVNGIDEIQPAFTFFSLEDLKEIKENGPKLRPGRANGGKLSYLLHAEDYYWSTFKGGQKKYGY